MKPITAPERAIRQLDAADPGRWLRAALRAVLRSAPKDVVARKGWPAQPMRGRSEPAHRKWYGHHSDNEPEVCIAVSGRAIVEIQNRRFLMSPPRLCVFEPGVSHCEAYVRRSERYNMVWLRIARGSVLGQVCPYYLPPQWDSIAAYSVPGSTAPMLYERLSDPDNPLTPDQFDAFRAELVVVLSAMLLVATRPTPPLTVRRDPVTHRIRPPHHVVIEQLKEQINHHLGQDVDLRQFSQVTRLSSDYIRKLFKRSTGMRIQKYLQRCRMDEAMRLCRETPMLVKEIARRVGYADPLYFSRVFHAYHRRWPTEVKRK